MEGRERLLRQLISDIITELAAIEAQEVGTCVADDIRGIRRMLADGVTALGSDTTRNATCALDGSRSYTQERDGWKCCTCGMMGPTLDAILLKHTCQAQDADQPTKENR
jgi:hypothetical protein